MSSSEERLTFEQMPQLVSVLKAEIIDLKTQVASLVVAIRPDIPRAPLRRCRPHPRTRPDSAKSS